jgi:hypothetical protein
VDDRLVHKLVDDVRYQASLRLKEDIQAGNATMLAVNKDDNEATKAVKRPRETYIVNAAKFSSIVTEQQLAHNFTEEDLGTEETHQILQHKIWYYYSIYYYSTFTNLFPSNMKNQNKNIKHKNYKPIGYDHKNQRLLSITVHLLITLFTSSNVQLPPVIECCS